MVDELVTVVLPATGDDHVLPPSLLDSKVTDVEPPFQLIFALKVAKDSLKFVVALRVTAGNPTGTNGEPFTVVVPAEFTALIRQ